MIIEYIHNNLHVQYNHNIICRTTGPLHVLRWLIPADIFSDNRKCNQFAHAQ